MDKIEWPSERVSHGGIFHQRNVNYSKETHEMIKSEKKIPISAFPSFISDPRPSAPSSADEGGSPDNDATQQDRLLPALRFRAAPARDADTQTALRGVRDAASPRVNGSLEGRAKALAGHNYEVWRLRNREVRGLSRHPRGAKSAISVKAAT